MFKYEYVPVDQLRSNVELVIGRAEFVVTGWTDKDKDGVKMTTRNGDPRINLILTIADAAGQQGKYFDILTPKMNWKLKQLLDAVGMPELYDSSGTIDLNKLIMKGGKCQLNPSRNPEYAKHELVYLTTEQAQTPYAAPIAAPLMPQNSYTGSTTSAAQMAEYDSTIPF